MLHISSHNTEYLISIEVFSIINESFQLRCSYFLFDTHIVYLFIISYFRLLHSVDIPCMASSKTGGVLHRLYYSYRNRHVCFFCILLLRFHLYFSCITLFICTYKLSLRNIFVCLSFNIVIDIYWFFVELFVFLFE